MRFIGDLHIHSHYSVATSSALNPENLDLWARLKGINVLGTGDAFHPGWYEELKEKLAEAEEGLFMLKQGHRIKDLPFLPRENPPVRFLLSGEISSIYKHRGRVRKVHNLIFCPSFYNAKKIQQQLERLGNIRSDGRPILGIASKDLLEIVLESGEDNVFVPAHIWTPWFSVLGEKSGYDSLEECFEDLTGHIFAVETGLSSDPPMNWLCSFLDSYNLISNSDAHSPEKLGREANIFQGEISYPDVMGAIRGDSKSKFMGTIEFFPQEGKYHLDGHRKCGIRWSPEQTIKNKGICPVCGKKVTVGVLNRVLQLADREDFKTRPSRHPYYSLTPLKNLIAEIKGVGPNSKQVNEYYRYLLEKGGAEFSVLLDLSLDHIKEVGNELLAEGIRRLRNGEVLIEEGYDGEFGHVKVFYPGETRSLRAQTSFLEGFNPAGGTKSKKLPLRKKAGPQESIESEKRPLRKKAEPVLHINDLQEKAIGHYKGPCLVLAGPGTGKTLTLTRRISRLVNYRKVDPESILAITFTNKAAEEMKTRIATQFDNGSKTRGTYITTFHSFGLSLLRKHAEWFGRTPEFAVFGDREREYLLRQLTGKKSNEIPGIINEIGLKKISMRVSSNPGDSELVRLYNDYEEILKKENAFDLDDLILCAVRLLKENKEAGESVRNRYPWMCIDEYQDINLCQYHLIRELAPGRDSNLFVIGDPDQAIYGFRGADSNFIQNFKRDYPGVAIYKLDKSYRCTNTVLEASSQVLNSGAIPLKGIYRGVAIQIREYFTEKSEAEFVARTIESIMGGTRFFSIDSRVADGTGEDEAVSFGDFAVLFRISRMAPNIVKAMNDHGLPYQLAGEEPFFKKEPISTIVDILRLTATPRNSILAKRLNEKGAKGLSPSLLAKIRAGDTPTVEECILEIAEKCLSDTDFTAVDTWDRFLSIARQYGRDISSFLSLMQLGAGADTINKSADQVALMTLHAAKGLEFSYVFIIGCEDGILPYTFQHRDEPDMEEEKRLLYVGMTRAKKMLFLSHSKKRNLYGRTLNSCISPFMIPVKEELLNRQKEEKRPARKGTGQLSLFPGIST